MSTGYILNSQKTFEIFLRTEKVLKNNLFPIVSKFVREEIDFWIKTAKRYIKKDEKIIEMGCGSGRILKELTKADFSAFGFDNDALFIDYCRKQNLKVFYLDATKAAPKKHKLKYKMAGIAVNTLFNFPKKIRKKWISSAHNLLKEKGTLIMTAYSDSRFSRTTIKERVKFYENVLMPPKDSYIEFFDDGKRKGVHLCGHNKKEIWFSEWISRGELLKEANSWKNFKVVSIQEMKCGIGWKLVSIKK
ncbi:MAG: class I SAM-dependent methyltransferase [bacterium]